MYVKYFLDVLICRTSYLPSEIFWGHRFEGMTLYRRDNKKYQVFANMNVKILEIISKVNFAAFHSTYEVDTPSCSAKELDMLYAARK